LKSATRRKHEPPVYFTSRRRHIANVKSTAPSFQSYFTGKQTVTIAGGVSGETDKQNRPGPRNAQARLGGLFDSTLTRLRLSTAYERGSRQYSALGCGVILFSSGTQIYATNTSSIVA
jgi:hypothetical protein